MEREGEEGIMEGEGEEGMMKEGRGVSGYRGESG